MNKVILAIVFCASAISAKAQTDKDLGTWFVANAEYEFAKNFIGYVELQVRTQKPFHKVFYGEIKGGVNYRINKNFSTLLGFGDYRTYDWKDLEAGVKTNELRLWEQLVISQPLDRLKFEHRFRAEQAWLNKKYRNRFRYRISLIIPLNKPKVERNTVFISLSDEIFLTNKAPYFMRNRAYAGIGFQATDFLTVQTGYVHQFNYTLASAGAKHNLFFSINFRFLRKDNKDEKIPTKRD
jgi:hypothetical protein